MNNKKKAESNKDHIFDVSIDNKKKTITYTIKPGVHRLIRNFHRYKLGL